MVKLNNPKAQVMALFPTPLYVTNYDGDTTEIVKYFNSQEFNSATPGYGHISKNSYIIDNPICKDLADWIKNCMRDYATNVMRYRYEDLVFTQSWLTLKTKNMVHKAHTHPNTLISPVFYYEMQYGHPPICFSKKVDAVGRSYIEPSLEDDYQNHIFSQEEYYYSPQQNDLIIFPSYFSHGVPPNTVENPRKSLGVNALPKGKIGDEETISGLIYSRYV